MTQHSDNFRPFRLLTDRGLAAPVADYEGPFADQYDAIGGRYEDDLPFYRREISGGKKVLEFGAGTGRLTLPLAADGNQVTALELSEAMLAILKDKLTPELAGKVELVVGSATELVVAEEFDVVLAPFNIIYHFLERQDRMAMVANAYRQLKPGGKFYLHYYFPDSDTGADQGGRFLSKVEGGQEGEAHMVCNYASFDDQSRLNTVESVHFQLNLDKTYAAHSQTYQEYHMPIPELKELLNAAGFTKVALFGDFQGTPLRDVPRKEFVIAVGHK